MEKKLETYTLLIWEEFPYDAARLFLIPDLVINKTKSRTIMNTAHGNYINSIDTEGLSDKEIKKIENSLSILNASVSKNIENMKTNVDKKWYEIFLSYEVFSSSVINLKNKKINHIIVTGWMD
jgi:tRNA U34 5-carboxymethylaminomethyl modifying enzyme MnmG/GidA